MFLPRLISGAVMMVIAFFALYFGGYVLWGLTLVLSIIGMFEMYRALGMKGKSLTLPGYLAVIGYYASIMPALMSEKTTIISVGILILGFLVTMSVYVFSFPKFVADEAFYALLGAIYPGVLLSFLYLTRTIEDGQLLTWLIFIAAWGSDTFAYCTGMICKKFFGTHQMTPKLSPKKSVEGGIGGLVFACLLGVIYGLVFKNELTVFTVSPAVACGIIAVFGGMIAMIGDLSASAIKRNHEIKDYGHLIPGHGGVMDRFDSIIFTAPCVYFLIVILQMI